MQLKLRLLGLALATAFAPLAAAQAPSGAATVRDAIQKAVVSNPEVQARWHGFLAAKEEQDVARGGFLPRVDVTAGVGRERQTDPNLPDRDYTRRGLTLSLNQMLWDGRATHSEVRRLGYAKLVRYYELQDIAEATALEALRAYEDVRRYRTLVTLAQDNYLQHRRIHAQIAERARAGVGRGVDLDQAVGRLALAESNLLTEASNLHDVSARYLRVVGELPGDDLTPSPLLREGMPPAVSEALRRAWYGNPSISAAVEGIRAAQSDLDGRRARFQPRVDVRLRSDLANNDQGIPGRSTTQLAEVVLNYNLFNGGSDRAAERQFAERINQAKDLRDKACRDVRQTVTIAYNDTVRLGEQLEFLDRHQQSIGKAREAYRAQFDIGQRSLLDLLDSENEYFEARRAYTHAIHDEILAYARTLAGMGRLLSSLKAGRPDLPTLADLGEDHAGVSDGNVCPPEAPFMPTVDKKAVIQTALGSAPPAPAVAPAPAPQPQPAPAPQPASVADDLTQRLRDWAAAWESKQYDAYFDFYAQTFTPTPGQTTGGPNRSAWERARQKYLSKLGPIEVKLSNIEVQQTSPDTAITEFRQDYTSSDFTDVVRKRLEWVRENGVWRIVREVVF